MQDERKRILDLVEKGTITAQDAIVLLEKLEQPSETNRRKHKIDTFKRGDFVRTITVKHTTK